ncbi:HEAT repeat containing 9 [Phyllostomus discolor]|uniref:HEAT repeat containing 9 n=1 Tax=Phyllostomus discolor TaxID=89673 RepID=A0A833ZHT6_9CHIR|nr:HEAT repeat containing 9 [Phyllostomus discolor]
MAQEKWVHISDISRSMLKYPWLEYPDRIKELKKAMAPVHLPLSCFQLPKEEYPPSPECWRLHQSHSKTVPYGYSEQPELYTYWQTLYEHRRERKAQKMLQKMRAHPSFVQRNLKEGTAAQKAYLPMTQLAVKPQKGLKSLLPAGDSLKQQRLKELTQSLKAPREDEQFYAAQALGCLGVGDKFVIEALLQVAQTGPERVVREAYRTLAMLGCLEKEVIQALITQLKGQSEEQRMDTLRGLRIALSSWAAVPKDKRSQVGDEGALLSVLQKLMQASPAEAALEAALCLGFLRPGSSTVREFLLQCLRQGPRPQSMKALRMLVKRMRVHSAETIRAILDQLCHSNVLEHRLEATQLLKAMGLEQIQAQGLEGLVFDLLRNKIHNEPFLVMRQAVAETVEELKMKPTMLNLVEAQLMSSNAIARREAVISLGVLGVRSLPVFNLLLDMLAEENSQSVKKSLQEAFVVLASTDPWIQNKVKNNVLCVQEAPKDDGKVEPTRFRPKLDRPEELDIQDFRLVQLRPLLIAKASAAASLQEKPSAQEGSTCYFASAFPPLVPEPQQHKPQVAGLWTLAIRKQLQVLAKTST